MNLEEYAVKLIQKQESKIEDLNISLDYAQERLKELKDILRRICSLTQIKISPASNRRYISFDSIWEDDNAEVFDWLVKLGYVKEITDAEK